MLRERKGKWIKDQQLIDSQISSSIWITVCFPCNSSRTIQQMILFKHFKCFQLNYINQLFNDDILPYIFLSFLQSINEPEINQPLKRRRRRRNVINFKFNWFRLKMKIEVNWSKCLTATEQEKVNCCLSIIRW